jgi:ABC-type transport system substrate-binding protein
MFNFKARDFFLAGFILGAVIVAVIMLSILIFQSRSTTSEVLEPVPDEPTRIVEEATVAPEKPTVRPTTTRAVDPDALSGLQYVLLNPTKPPLDDVNVRQALRFAIDRGRLAEIALEVDRELMNTYPTGTMAPGFMQPPGLQDELMQPYDPERARALLEEAGLDGLELFAAVPPGQTWLYEVYADMWAPLNVNLDFAELDEQKAAEAKGGRSDAGPGSRRLFESAPQIGDRSDRLLSGNP